jgi:hypothetical protein
MRPSPARHSAAQLGPRAPGVVPSPMCAPSPGPFPSFNSPVQQPPSLSHLSLSLSLSPRGALGFGDGDRRNLDPRGELPSPSLSLFLSPSPFFPCALPCFPPVRTPLRGLGPDGAAPVLPVVRPPPLPAARPPPSPAAASAPCARPPAPAARLPVPLRATVPAPVRGPCLRQRGPQRGSRSLDAPPFTQCVPTWAAPHAR